jgi:hypothetical protein
MWVVTFKLLPLYQQHSFNKRLSRSQNWCDHSSKEKNHCQALSPIITAVAMLSQLHTIIWNKQNENYCNQQESNLNHAKQKSDAKQHANWIHMAQNRVQYWAVVNNEIRFHKKSSISWPAEWLLFSMLHAVNNQYNHSYNVDIFLDCQQDSYMGWKSLVSCLLSCSMKKYIVGTHMPNL